MIRRAVSRMTYANVAATLALFVALGGSAYAGLAVTGSNVVNGSLSGADVHDGSLTGADVRNESLTGADIKNLTAADFRHGRLLTSGARSVVQASGTVGSDGTGTQVAPCTGGKLPTGGGYDAANTHGNVIDSFPVGNGWVVFILGGTPGTPFAVYAVCSS